jgi:hypothetical protein
MPWSWIRSTKVFSYSLVVIIASRICRAASDASLSIIAVIRKRSASLTSTLAMASSTLRAPASNSMSMPPMLAAKTVRYGLPVPSWPGGPPESMTIGARSNPGWPVRMTWRHFAASAGSGQSTTRTAAGHLARRRAVVM